MELANKGKRLLITTAITLLTLELIWIFVHFFIGFGGEPPEGYRAAFEEAARIALIQDILRFILHCLLFAFVYKSHRWAKWATVAVVAIAIIADFIDLTSLVRAHITIFGSFELTSIPDYYTYHVIQVLLIAAGIFTICVVLSKPVKAYQNQVRPSASAGQPPTFGGQPQMQYGQAPMPYQPGQSPSPYPTAPGSGFIPQTPMTPVTPVPPTLQPDTTWTCSCGTVNQGQFCSNCGQPRPTI